MSLENETDPLSGTETTGHEWDGIKELNNPLPRWWLWTFYGTIVFSLLYTILYPAWPLISASTGGLLGWSSRDVLATQIAAVETDRATLSERLIAMDLAEVSNHPDLMRYAEAGGSSAFKVYCSQCHGAGAAGGSIYPNLIDDDWIWGGTLEAIYTTLKHGIRYEADPETRYSLMPAFGADGLLARGEIRDLAWYVMSLSGAAQDQSTATPQALEAGAVLYADNCAVCHGEAGEGIQDLGAPALNDAIWFYGSSHSELVAQIYNPKQGVMPGWQDRLSEGTLRQLAIYVHGLGGGE